MTEEMKKILVVEDDVPNSIVAQHFLEMFGYESDVAHTGSRALELTEKNRYAAILMDVTMPDMNGLDITRALRGREQQMPVQAYIIGMTAHASNEDRDACLGAGMNDFIKKPFDGDTLREKLQECTQIVPSATPTTALSS